MDPSSLLERLGHAESPAALRGLGEAALARRSVVRHLLGLLNTRRGSAPIDAGYGMPDMSNIAGSFAVGSTQSIQDDLLRQVAVYEPRLHAPSIRSVDELHAVISLRFELRATLQVGLAPDIRSEPFAATLRLNAAGRVAVELCHDA